MSGRDFWKPGGVGRGVVLVPVALALGWAAMRGSLVQSLARGNPDLALRLEPTNATALNTQFRKTLDPRALSPDRLAGWAAKARASLRASPLSPATIRLVSIDPAHPSAAETLRLAERVSRRDALTQLALIETAVAENRVDAALAHYDRALSIYPDLRPLLFPVLAGALAEADVRRGVVELARRRKSWIDPFLHFAVEKGAADPVATVLTALDRGPGALPSAREHQAALANRLIGMKDYAAAHRLAMRAAGPDALWIDRIGFAPSTWMTNARPLTWFVAGTEGIDAQLQQDRSVLATVRPGGAGLAFFRVLKLSPGGYRFAANAAAPGSMATAGGRWDFICLRADGRPDTPIAEMRVDVAGSMKTTGTLAVAPDCAATRVGFTIDNIDGGADAGVVLRDIALSRIR